LLDGRVLLDLADARLDIAATGHELPFRRAAMRTVPAAPGSTRIEPEPAETVRSPPRTR